MYLWSELNVLVVILLGLLWAVSGLLIVSRLFDLPPAERGLVGFGVGIISSTWLANLLGQFLPIDVAFWAAPLLILAFGLAVSWPLKRDVFRLKDFQLSQWGTFLLLVFVFTLINRGLGIFDDAQNLPPVSTLAAGDLPPHFAFDPALPWGYHYFVLLLAAQFVRLAGAAPWTGLDLARGLTMSLGLVLAGLLAYRITKNRMAQVFSGIFFALAGGARWLFFLIPVSVMNRLSSSITLIGSGADSGVNLAVAMYKIWDIQGVGPFPFPFTVISGLMHSFVLAMSGIAGSDVVIVLLMILLAGKHRSRWGFVPLIILLASLALSNEVTFVFFYAGLGIAVLFSVLQTRSWKIPASLWGWIGVLFVAGVFSLFEGGIISETVRAKLLQMTSGGGDTYYQVTFALGAPQFLSAHLGTLSLLNPLHWIAILAECGLAIFALPLVLKKLWNEARDENWIQAAWLATVVVSLLTVFIQYTGNAGPTAISRLHGHFLTVTRLYAVPLVWEWVQNRSESIKLLSLSWGFASILSGAVILFAQLTAMPNPVYGEFLGHLDERMFRAHWNQLAPDTMVFDPVHPRGVTVFGRFTKASVNYGPPTDEWISLAENPDPQDLLAAGYQYVYYDYRYGKKYERVMLQSCVEKLDYIEELASDGKLVDSRTLLGLGKCQP